MSTSRNSTLLYEDIRSLVLSARHSAARGINLLQVYTNYEIGRRIFEQEQQGAERAQYGKELVRELAARLTGEFGSGFSISNLKYMRQFYMAYPERVPRISQTASGQFQPFPISQSLTGNSGPLPIGQTVSGQLDSSSDSSHHPFSLSWSHYVFLVGLKEQERNFYEIEAALRANRPQDWQAHASGPWSDADVRQLL
jgi:hypothetical protein